MQNFSNSESDTILLSPAKSGLLKDLIHLFANHILSVYIRGQESERLEGFYPANFVCASNFNFRSYWRSPFILFVWSRATPAINAKFLPPAADDLSTSVFDHRKSIVEMVELAQNSGTPREYTAFTTGNERILRS